MIRPTTGDGRLTVPSSKSMRERWSATPIPRSNMCTSAQDRTGECAWELCKGILEGGNFTERNPATAHCAGVWHGRVQKWWRKGWSGAHQTFSEERVVSTGTVQVLDSQFCLLRSLSEFQHKGRLLLARRPLSHYFFQSPCSTLSCRDVPTREGRS